MVSLRCKMAVKEELDKLKLKHTAIDLGEVALKKNISGDDRELLRKGLLKKGLELIDDKKSLLIAKTKQLLLNSFITRKKIPKSIIPITLAKNSTTITTNLPPFFQKLQELQLQITSSSTR
jgi:hypothetical protein